MRRPRRRRPVGSPPTGRAEVDDVTAEGHLVVETDGGERRTLAVGDVVHLRPAGGG